MFTPFMLQACGFLTLNRGDWIGINALVVVLSIMIAALVYTVGNFLPAERKDKIKGAVRYEIIEALISLIIIITLILFASLACSAGGALVGSTGSYTDLFSAANGYIGDLLFTNGLSVLSNIYTVSTQYEIVSSLFTYGAGDEGARPLLTWTILPNVASVTAGDGGFLFYGKIDALHRAVRGFLDLSFGGLFVLFLAL